LKQIHIKLPESLHRELRIQAAIKGQTLQGYVVEALEGKINSDKATNNPTHLAKESVNSDITE
jgi:plasmid stability protein